MVAQTCRGVARSKTVGWTEGASRTHGERGARAITGVWGRAPSGGTRGQSPLKLKAFCRWTTQTRVKIYHFSLVFLKPPVSQKWCLEWIKFVNFLPWSRFLIIVSSPACIRNRNHFHGHRYQILIGSLVNNKQVNGGALQKNIYSQAAAVRVRWLYSHPPLPKNTPDLHQSQE